MKKYICDKCKQETKSYDLINLRPDDLKTKDFDLCENCFNEVSKFIKNNDWTCGAPKELKKKWWR